MQQGGACPTWTSHSFQLLLTPQCLYANEAFRGAVYAAQSPLADDPVVKQLRFGARYARVSGWLPLAAHLRSCCGCLRVIPRGVSPAIHASLPPLPDC